MSKIQKIRESLSTIAKAAVTWLVAISAGLQVVADNLGDVYGGSVTEWITRVVGWIGVAVTIIRSHQPVLSGERGILPKE